jgi:ribosomal protein S18 acetylase RimI-like enzyme
MVQIQSITTAGPALQAAVQLFKAYAAELDENLCFQGFTEELDNPLKKYGPPTGALLLAYYNQQPIGCVAIQALPQPATCEMKRLYVLPQYRQLKAGKLLATAIIHLARQMGYTQMKLDTLQRLQPAIQLYRQLGFETTTSYYNNPLPGVVYMQKAL